MCVCVGTSRWGIILVRTIYLLTHTHTSLIFYRLTLCPHLHVSSPPPLSLTLSAAYLQSNQVMGWGEKAIELRSANTGNLEGVFMHKKAQKLKFLCERNDKVGVTLHLHSLKLQSNVFKCNVQ